MLASCVTVRSSDTVPGDVSEMPAQLVPVVIAHRGASGTLPEHTLAAYQLAIEQGADFIEPDLVMTKDGILVVRHDPWLSDSTDIADHPEFADRKTTVVSPEGQRLTDWFVWDFTLEEIKTLRAKQARADRDQSNNDQFEIPTFEEVLNLAGMTNHGRKPATPEDYLGVYSELKWPKAHESRDLDIADAANTSLVYALTRTLVADLPVHFTAPPRPTDAQYRADPCYWRRCTLRVRIQSFEDKVLRRLNEFTDWKLVQLVYPEGYKPDGKPSYDLEEIATYAVGVGPYKSLVMDPVTGQSTGYAQKARALGLEVHPWTFRDDDMPTQFESPEDEIHAVLDAGATGFFTDYPETGVKAVKSWLEEQSR